MPSQVNSPAILHLRDFINSVGPDPSRPGQGLALQIEASLHLPFQTDLYSDDVELAELPTTIHFFASPGNSQSYDLNKLIYAWGSFLTCVDPDGFLHLILHAHEVDWWDFDALHHPCFPTTEGFLSHPGDHSDPHMYNMHCPEAALPSVSLLGIVRGGAGQLNNGSTLLHYDLETKVYDLSNKSSVTFTVSIYFRNGNRWTNFPILAMQSRIFIAGRIFGTTTNTPRLAIGVDDVYFIPNLGSITTPPMTPTSSAGKQKQADRWNARANPLTPMKRPRTLISVSDSHSLDEGDQIPQTSPTSATTTSSDAHVPVQSEHSNEARSRDATVENLTPREDKLSADTIHSDCRPQRRRKFSRTNLTSWYWGWQMSGIEVSALVFSFKSFSSVATVKIHLPCKPFSAYTSCSVSNVKLHYISL